MIQHCIETLKDYGGTSYPAILKWTAHSSGVDEYDALSYTSFKTHLLAALKTGVASARFTKAKYSYKMNVNYTKRMRYRGRVKEKKRERNKAAARALTIASKRMKHGGDKRGLLCAPPAKKEGRGPSHPLPPRQNKRAARSSSRDAPAERIPSLTSGKRSKTAGSTVSPKPTSPPRSDASRYADRYRNDDDYDAEEKEEDIYSDYAPFVAKKKKGGKEKNEEKQKYK